MMIWFSFFGATALEATKESTQTGNLVVDEKEKRVMLLPHRTRGYRYMGKRGKRELGFGGSYLFVAREGEWAHVNR